MTSTIRLIGIVGSLRIDSYNRSLFNAAIELVPNGVELTEVPLKGLPLYDGDVESNGDPAEVAEFKHKVDAADALIVFTPEYNRSVPAVTKNAIDWLSRFPGESVLSRTAVGIVAASPGGHEANGVRSHISASVLANTQQLYAESLGIGSIGDKLTNGRLSNQETREQLAQWLSGFVHFVREQSDD